MFAMPTVTAVPRLRAPIILVHGLLGFDAIRIGKLELIPYFRDVAPFLRRAGNRVFVARLSPTSRVPQRAEQLLRFVKRVSPIEPVHLFAHSLGGLDGRYAIARLGMNVLTLTTLGTPHRGTSFADWGLMRFRWILQPGRFPNFQFMPALLDLTTTACQQFNRDIQDTPQVRYFSVAGRYAGAWPLSSRIVTANEGDNDGVVSLASANYGESFDVWNGDHLSLINWPTPGTLFSRQWCDHREDYANLVRRLSDLGY